MTDRGALLASVFAHPDEDVIRLMYADEIEETEPIRAEFIRVQCRIAAMCEGHRRGEPTHPEFDAHQERESELWTAAAWPIQRLANAMGDTENDCLIRRGFLEAMTCPAAWWLAHADAILAVHPVQTVTLTSLPPIHTTFTRPTYRAIAAGAPDVTDHISYMLRGRKLEHRVSPAESRHYEAGGIYRRGMMLELLKREWPRIRTWNLTG